MQDLRHRDCEPNHNTIVRYAAFPTPVSSRFSSSSPHPATTSLISLRRPPLFLCLLLISFLFCSHHALFASCCFVAGTFTLSTPSVILLRIDFAPRSFSTPDCKHKYSQIRDHLRNIFQQPLRYESICSIAYIYLALENFQYARQALRWRSSPADRRRSGWCPRLRWIWSW